MISLWLSTLPSCLSYISFNVKIIWDVFVWKKRYLYFVSNFITRRMTREGRNLTIIIIIKTCYLHNVAFSIKQSITKYNYSTYRCLWKKQTSNEKYSITKKYLSINNIIQIHYYKRQQHILLTINNHFSCLKMTNMYWPILLYDSYFHCSFYKNPTLSLKLRSMPLLLDAAWNYGKKAYLLIC